MLETILNQINSNLEKIAKAQERRNKLLESQIASNLKPEDKAQEEQKVLKDIPQVIPQVQPAVQQQVQVQNQANAIPTTPTQESFTQEQLAVAMSNAVSAGKMDIIQNILQQFGVQALTQINPNDYNKVATMLKEAEVEI